MDQWWYKQLASSLSSVIKDDPDTHDWLAENIPAIIAKTSRRTRLEVLEEVEGMVRGQKASFVEGRTATYAGTRHLLLTRLASLKKKYEE